MPDLLDGDVPLWVEVRGTTRLMRPSLANDLTDRLLRWNDAWCNAVGANLGWSSDADRGQWLADGSALVEAVAEALGQEHKVEGDFERFADAR